MSNAPEDFEKLCKLLKLKRHEQPPPGYFNNFSSQVISRLKTQAQTNTPAANVAWVNRLLRRLETSPLFAGAFSVATCGVLIFGIVSFQYVDRTSVALVAPESSKTTATLLTKSSSETVAPSMNPMFNTNIPGASTFGALSLSSDQQNNNDVQPVLFTPGQ